MAWKLEIGNRNTTVWTDRTSIIDRDTMMVGGLADRTAIDTGSGFDLADDAGAISLAARRVVRVIEDATTPDTTMFRGRLISNGRARGTLPIGDAKQFDVSLVDYNADFGGIPLSRITRPQEYDHQRIRFVLEHWLQGAYRPSTDIADTYLQSTNPILLPRYVYDAPPGGPAGIFQHVLSEVDGKECFITVDGELFYGPSDSLVYAAGLSITDVNPNGTTSFAPIGPTGEQDGGEWVGGVKVVYRNRRFVYVTDPPALDAHDYWLTTLVDETIPNEAAARRRGGALLAEHKDEETSYRCAILLRNTQVDLIKYGQTVSFRSAAAGVLTPLVLRVKRLIWEPTGSEHWTAHLELDFPRPLAAKLPFPRQGEPGPFVPGDDLEPSPAIGGTLTIHTKPHPSFPNRLWTLYTGPDFDHMTIKVDSIPAGDYAYPVADVNAEHCIFIDGSAFGDTSGGVPFDGITWTPTGGSGTYHVENGDGLGGHFFQYDIAIPNAFTADISHWSFPVYATPITGATDGVADYGLGLNNAVSFLLPAGVLSVRAVPFAGQEVTEATIGDGTTTSRATNYPYQENSLEIYVGGIRVVPTQVDPELGTFTLPFAPATGTQILIRYVASDGTDLGTGNDDTPDSVVPTIPAVTANRWEPVIFDNAGTPEPVYFQDAAGVWDIVMHEVTN